jgi:hypothetical protein
MLVLAWCGRTVGLAEALGVRGGAWGVRGTGKGADAIRSDEGLPLVAHLPCLLPALLRRNSCSPGVARHTQNLAHADGARAAGCHGVQLCRSQA